MPIMTHRTTFALDKGTAIRLKRLASRWQVSQAEVVRRAVAEAEERQPPKPDAEQRIAAALRMRESLQSRKINVDVWIQEARKSRR